MEKIFNFISFLSFRSFCFLFIVHSKYFCFGVFVFVYPYHRLAYCDIVSRFSCCSNPSHTAPPPAADAFLRELFFAPPYSQSLHHFVSASFCHLWRYFSFPALFSSYSPRSFSSFSCDDANSSHSTTNYHCCHWTRRTSYCCWSMRCHYLSCLSYCRTQR